MVMDKKFRLRWALEYHHRKPIYGVWDDGSPHQSDSAWIKPKEGLKYAAIEGEELHAWGIYRFLECEADRFVCFKWITAVAVPCFGNAVIRSSGNIIGLQLLTPENAYSCFIDGKITQKKLDDHEKRFDLREFQTGVI